MLLNKQDNYLWNWEILQPQNTESNDKNCPFQSQTIVT